MEFQGKKVRYGSVIFCLFIILAMSVWALNEKPPSGTWRYKMTVEVETPEGIKSGLAVREVTIHSLGGRPCRYGRRIVRQECGGLEKPGG
jgi:hypothetical protein